MNRIVGKCYIVDSAGLWLTSNSASNGNFLDLEFQSIALIGNNSSQIEITLESNTASSVVFRLFGALDYTTTVLDFPKGFCVEERMFVKTCANGTGLLYFN